MVETPTAHASPRKGKGAREAALEVFVIDEEA
jgi:hypothetical protein